LEIERRLVRRELESVSNQPDRFNLSGNRNSLEYRPSPVQLSFDSALFWLTMKAEDARPITPEELRRSEELWKLPS
jgi:hypothetical protein